MRAYLCPFCGHSLAALHSHFLTAADPLRLDTCPVCGVLVLFLEDVAPLEVHMQRLADALRGSGRQLSPITSVYALVPAGLNGGGKPIYILAAWDNAEGLDVQQVAAIRQVHPRTIQRQCQAGQYTGAIRGSSRTRRFPQGKTWTIPRQALWVRLHEIPGSLSNGEGMSSPLLCRPA